MRKTAILVATASLALASAGAVQADEPSAPPVHGHILVLGVEFGETGVTFRKCVDIAAGQALPLHVHHGGLHAGTAGDALREADNFPVPTAPLAPWRNCADFVAMMKG